MVKQEVDEMASMTIYPRPPNIKLTISPFYTFTTSP